MVYINKYFVFKNVHSKRAYNTIKAITNPTNRKISNIDIAKLDRRTEYYKYLYNTQ